MVGYLNIFYNCFGEKVNLSKSRLFCSHNVNYNVARHLSDKNDFALAYDLGKDYGVPLHDKFVNKDTYNFIIDKTNKRLSTWKRKTLSLAGRITLCQLVLNFISIFYMHIAFIPISVCKNIDKIC